MGGVETACKGKKYHHLAKLRSNMDPFLLHSCKYPKYQVLAALRYADLPEAFKFFIEAQFRTIDVDGDGSIGQ